MLAQHVALDEPIHVVLLDHQSSVSLDVGVRGCLGVVAPHNAARM